MLCCIPRLYAGHLLSRSEILLEKHLAFMAFVMLEAIAQGTSQGKMHHNKIYVYIYLQNNTGFKINGQCLLEEMTCLCSFCTQICWQ